MTVPLFPLQTVLFPGGVLPLRIFEARYMDMVRDCLKQQAPFGVCLIARGAETGKSTAIEPVGCLASIVAWDMQQLGVLNIRTIGLQRFRVLRQTVQPDGLLIGEIEMIDPDQDRPLAPEHAPCGDLLRRVIEDVEANRAGRSAEGNGEPIDPPFERPFRFDSSVWVGNRVCEVLSVPLKAKQKLMELEDAGARLDIVLRYLRQHGVIK